MHVLNCEHPVRIVNPYTNLVEFVPCGKCACCRNAKSSVWVQRLNQECMCWKYVAFVTLTYSEDFVNQMEYDPKDNSLLDVFTGNYIQCPVFGAKTKAYLRRRRTINVLSVQDCQRFIKRLRYFIKELHEKEQSQEAFTLRYYLCGEYGPTTFRPHYHCLFFFNSSLTAAKFNSLLHKSWKDGLVDWSFVRSNASSYVAQYVNCTTHLPQVYQIKQIKPFALFSKCPPIGTLQIKSEEVQKIFNNGIIERSIYNSKQRKYDNVPLWRSLQDRLFPKVAGFSYLSHNDRVALYGISKFSQAQTFEEFVEWCEKQVNIGLSCFSPVGFFNSLAVYSSRAFSSKTLSSWRNLWYVSKRVMLQSSIFGVSLDTYVSKIEQYYANKESHRLKRQLMFEQEFARRFGAQSLVYLDLSFVERSVQFSYTHLSNAEWITLEGFGIDPVLWCLSADYRRSLDIFNNPNHKTMVENARWIFKKSSKTKRKNDFLAIHPEFRYF